ncbi:MAG TPA: redoxin domain-containing protein [Pyrinomonadaceae bacterium]|jgi:thiol-disulfide isomerase/thioredoxin|nr:redoxin domain-containing protein [Pyrinomonadaceae bacterium]
MENKKSKFARAVEIATNLSIIAVALVGASVLVKNYLLRPALPSPGPTAQAAAARNPNGSGEGQRTPPSGPATGTQISLPGINWSDSEETVVLALSDKCHFCTESAPFYQRLTQELASHKNVRVVAVFPQEVDAGKKYLDGLKVSIADIAQAQLDSFGVRGTPTLMIVDKSGTVKQSWVGRLTTEREAEVLSRVKT